MSKVQQQVQSRPPWERMMRFHNLIQNGDYPNCFTLAREFEVSVRTVNRDLDFMKDRLNLPIEYDSQRRGYYYTRPVKHFPQVPVTEAEIFALLVAHKAIAQYHGTPFQQPLEMAFRKLTGQLDRAAEFTVAGLGEMVSFRPFAPEDTDLEKFEIITRALRERRVLKFAYRNLGAKRHAPRLVHPYHLACIENQWYLFAFVPDRKDIRTFLLTRLLEPEITQETFLVSKKFDPNDHLSGSLSVFRGAEDYEVVIDFDSWAADLIKSRKWHSSQHLTEIPGGQVRFQMRLNSLEEAERWVLSWGTHATVVRPQALTARLCNTALELQKRYAEPKPLPSAKGDKADQVFPALKAFRL